MKILYFAFSKADLDGVTKKILMQHDAFQSCLQEVETYILSSTKPTARMLEIISQAEGIKIHIEDKTSLGSLGSRRERINFIVKRTLEEDPTKTIVYIRYPIADFFFWRLTTILRNYFLITEHQTKEMKELIMRKAFPQLLSEFCFARMVRKNLSALTGVTQEICNYENFKDCSIPFFVASNGIKVSSLSIRKTPNWTTGDTLHLISVAQVARWHGLDRLIWGMANSDNSNIYLHIVGEGPAIPQLTALVSKKELEDKVIFHGFKTGEELDKMFNYCHIAVGSLGIHRKGLNETSELKAREYCARGIPFFCSSKDGDFPNDYPFRLTLPSDESPIDIETIYDFASIVLCDHQHPKKMREFATKFLDWKIKMEKLVHFFHEVIEELPK